MATGLGLTKYGFSVDYSVDADTRVSRTYNGINFSSDTAVTKAQQLNGIVFGNYTVGTSITELVGSIYAIARALGMQAINGIELIQRNTVGDV